MHCKLDLVVIEKDLGATLIKANSTMLLNGPEG
jgi:hypothetical protein